jgi:hypothetical protein
MKHVMQSFSFLGTAEFFTIPGSFPRISGCHSGVIFLHCSDLRLPCKAKRIAQGRDLRRLLKKDNCCITGHLASLRRLFWFFEQVGEGWVQDRTWNLWRWVWVWSHPSDVLHLWLSDMMYLIGTPIAVTSDHNRQMTDEVLCFPCTNRKC